MYRLKVLNFVVLATDAILVPSQVPAQKPDRNRSANELTTPEKSRVDSLIEMAVRKESAGEIAERDRLLDEAAAIAGTRLTKLNRLRGLVFEDGKWSTPTEFAHQSGRDQKLAEYRQF